MSGRIYDPGINPICDICGSKMWTTAERNFNGTKCKRKNCNGEPIYTKFMENKELPKGKNENGKYILEGSFTTFGVKKSKYTLFERFRNVLFTIIHGY